MMDLKCKKNVQLLILCGFICCFTACSKGDKDIQGEQTRAPGTTQAPEPVQEAPASPPAEPQTTSLPETTPTPIPPAPAPQKTNIVASVETPLVDKSKSRIHNIRVASDKINGYVLKPGEIFSFNDVVGDREKSTGFRKAIVFIRGKKVYEEGGGICQISSTLNLAAVKAKMEVLERHNHSRPVDYVKLGQDAAVSFGQLDFKFKNTKDYPVKIEINIQGNAFGVNFIKVTG